MVPIKANKGSAAPIGVWTWVYFISFCFIGGPLLILTGIIESGHVYGIYHQRFGGNAPDSIMISGMTVCGIALIACLYRITVGIQLIKSRDESLPQKAIEMTWWTGPVLGLASLVAPVLILPWLSWGALATPAFLLSITLSLLIACVWSTYFKKSSMVAKAYTYSLPLPNNGGLWGRVRRLLWNPPS